MLSPNADGRLIIVSNRLPVCINQSNNCEYNCTPSSGGLVSGLGGLSKRGVDFLWYGWPGLEIPPQDIPHVRELLFRQHRAVPVLLDQQLARDYYDGFSNSTIWPLFHHQHDLVSFDHETEIAYRKANEAFADMIAAEIQDGDLIWVHDYHLMLLPLLLRQRAAKMNIRIRIGWFLHTPFPEKDTFAQLPLGQDILNGIIGADVVGFQTTEARRNFISTTYKLLGQRSLDRMCSGREISVGIYPIGIEPSDFQGRLRNETVQKMIHSMRRRLDGMKIIVGVDRLDIIKGVPQKLRAFERFLEKHPQWVGRVILVQHVIPSRVNLEVNQRLRKETQQVAGSINDRHGSMGYVPVHLLYRSIGPEELTALYSAADVCFVSSIHDGMNLVSCEYVACHNDKAKQSSQGSITRGSLVLSKFAGAADILDGSILVDPLDPDDCAEALEHAVSMTVDEADKRMQRLGAKVENHTSFKWGASFVEALEQDSTKASLRNVVFELPN